MTDNSLPNIPGLMAAMQTVMDSLGPVTASMVQYRQNLEAAGYSPTIAEMVAAQLHCEMNKSFIALMMRST